MLTIDQYMYYVFIFLFMVFIQFIPYAFIVAKQYASAKKVGHCELRYAQHSKL